MKIKSLLLLSIFLINALGLISQNAKRSSQSFKYEYLPFYPQPLEYKNFRVALASEATDGIPLDSRKLYYKEVVINGLRNATEARATEAGGAFVGTNKSINSGVESANPNTDSDLEVTISYGNIELTDKSIWNTYAEGYKLQPGEINYMNFKLTFKYPYRLKVFDRRKNQVVFDSLINRTVALLFPKDYREGVSFPGYANKMDLDLDYNKNGKDVYFLTKSFFMAPYINECNAILRNSVGYFRDGFTMGITRVKSKKPVFDICDTVSAILETISDSISLNSKNEKHINWHTKGLKAKAFKLETIWNDMLTNEVYLGEFKDMSEKAEYLKGIKINKAYALVLQDKFDEALIALDEASPEITQNGGKVTSDQTDVRALRVLINREKYLYNKHKAFYNFN